MWPKSFTTLLFLPFFDKMTYQLFVLLRNRPFSPSQSYLDVRAWNTLWQDFLMKSQIKLPSLGVVAMDADELRLVWTHMRGTAMTIDRRLTVEQTLNINRPSWCREHDHGPDVNPAIFTDFSQPYILTYGFSIVDCSLTPRINQKIGPVSLTILQFAPFHLICPTWAEVLFTPAVSHDWPPMF